VLRFSEFNLQHRGDVLSFVWKSTATFTFIKYRSALYKSHTYARTHVRTQARTYERTNEQANNLRNKFKVD